MDFLNEFSKRVTNVARSVSEKSRENPELSRLNGELKAAAEELEKLYARYGKACYALSAGSGSQEAVEKLAVRVHAAILKLEELKARRDVAQGFRRCASCGTFHPNQARFCSNCGKRLPEESPRPEPLSTAQYCPKCGAERAPGQETCPVCGAALSDAAPDTPPEAPEAAPAGPDIEEPAESDAGRWE